MIIPTQWASGSPELQALWGLDPSIRYLNHGAFGATPKIVLEAQANWTRQLERGPVNFLIRRFPELMDAHRLQLSHFLGADAAGLVFVSNATSAVGAVLESLDLQAGDEVVVSNHGYHIVRQTLEVLKRERGISICTANIPFPCESHQEIADEFVKAFSKRTRLIIVDHIASASALILPVEDILRRAREQDIPVLVDGAHAPMQISLDLGALNADFYVGNLHKWPCAPKGSAFLYVNAAWRESIHPSAPAYRQAPGYHLRDGFHGEFDWLGTFDPSAWLSVKAAIEFFQNLGIERVRASNHALVREARSMLSRELGFLLPHPDDSMFYGSMAALEIPRLRGIKPFERASLSACFHATHGIEIPFMSLDGDRTWLRISAQVYNSFQDYEKLAAACLKEFGRS